VARARRTDGEFRAAVEAAIASLERGEVVSYGEIAEQAGYPGAARAVGAVLRDASPGLAWWRVVAADGRLVSPSATEQAARLRAEGVRVVDGRVRAPRRHSSAPSKG
jgi:methylated-DNA-protein-cysteine methyltransferase-like protein